MATYVFSNNNVINEGDCPSGFVPVSIKSARTHGWAAIAYGTSGKISVYSKTACLLVGGSQSTATKVSSVIDSTTGVLIYCPDWVEIYVPNTWRGMYVNSAKILLYNESINDYEETNISEYSSCQYYTDLQRYTRVQYNLQGGSESVVGFMGSYIDGVRCRALASHVFNRMLTSDANLNLLVDCIWDCDPLLDMGGHSLSMNVQNSSLNRISVKRTKATLIIKDAVIRSSYFAYTKSYPYIRFVNCSLANNVHFIGTNTFKINEDDVESRVFLRQYLDACFAYNYTNRVNVALGLPQDIYEEYKTQIDSASSGENRDRTDNLYITYSGSL